MRRRISSALAVLLGLAFALGVSEWALRTFDLGPLSRAPAPMAVDPDLVFHQHDPDPAVGYTMRPGKEGKLQNLPTRINSYGCRGGEPTGDDPLVVALGDSITFGAGVHEAQAFPALVAGELARREQPIRMLGCGTSGYNLEQMMARYDRDLAGLRPSLVLLNLFVDDLSPAYVLEDRSLASWLRFRSALFRAVERSRLWPGTGNRPVPGWARDGREYSAAVSQRLATFLRRHRASGTEFLGITHPLLGEPLFGTAGPLEQLTLLAADERVAVVRMRPVYAEATDGDILSLSINPNAKDPHPNAKGHRLIAGQIVDAIEAGKLLDPSHRPPAAPEPIGPGSAADSSPTPEPIGPGSAADSLPTMDSPPTLDPRGPGLAAGSPTTALGPPRGPPPGNPPRALGPGWALPGRICAVLDDGAASAGVRYWQRSVKAKAEWIVVTAGDDPLKVAMDCVEQGAAGLLVAVDPMATERVLRGPAFDTIAVAVPLPGPPPRGQWGPNSIGGGAPIEGVGATIGDDGGGVRSITVLHIPGPIGQAIGDEVEKRLGIPVTAVAVDQQDKEAWSEAAAAATGDGLVVVGPPPLGAVVAQTLKEHPRTRVWFSEWSTHPSVLDAVVAADALEAARWVNRLSPTAEFWQPARQAEGDLNADLFSAGASVALLLDGGVGSEGGMLSDIVARAESLAKQTTPYGEPTTLRTGGILHLARARYGIIRGVEGVDGGWAFSKVAPAGGESP